MILPDANILLYAYNKQARLHKAAQAWFQEALTSSDLFCLSWQTITAFLRIGTNPRAFSNPLSRREAVSAVSDWLTLPDVTILGPGERHWLILSDLIEHGQTSGPLIMDAHLAALAIEHGATLYTTDRDFARFRGLRVINPLE